MESNHCISLKKFFNYDYIEIGLNNNSKLPQWLRCKMKFGVIYVYGTPTD